LSKGTKTAVTRNASLPLLAFALPNGQNLGWNYFAPRHPSPAHAKTSYALLPHRPALFCPFSPEAVLLTILGDNESLCK
jgi:hypothetical protein